MFLIVSVTVLTACHIPFQFFLCTFFFKLIDPSFSWRWTESMNHNVCGLKRSQTDIGGGFYTMGLHCCRRREHNKKELKKEKCICILYSVDDVCSGVVMTCFAWGGQVAGFSIQPVFKGHKMLKWKYVDAENIFAG